jgi:hypothetical protein
MYPLEFGNKKHLDCCSNVEVPCMNFDQVGQLEGAFS